MTKKNKIILTAGLVAAFVLVLAVLSLLGVNINWYGLLIGCAFLIGVFVLKILLEKCGFNGDDAYTLLLIIFPFAIVGARFFYVLFQGTDMTFMEAIAIWQGGLSIIGGVIGGFCGLVVFLAYKKRLNDLWKVADCIVPCLLFGQALGRWGNFANQEVFGNVVTNPDLQWFPFAVLIDATGNWHYALFFYESMLNLVGVAIMLIMFKKFKNTGIITAFYFMFYGLVRFIMEEQRYSIYILQTSGGAPISKIFSLIFFVLGVALFVYSLIKYLKSKKQYMPKK